VLLDYAAGWVWRHPAGPARRVAGVWAVIGVAAAILVMTWLLTWLLAGARTFWPAWALLGLATAGSAYSLIALHDRVLIANGGRALRRRSAGRSGGQPGAVAARGLGLIQRGVGLGHQRLGRGAGLVRGDPRRAGLAAGDAQS
jgi:hypothetical protein